MYIQLDKTITSVPPMENFYYELTDELYNKIMSIYPRFDFVIENEHLVDVIPKDLDSNVEIDLKKTEVRIKRKPILSAFDIYKTNVIYGVVSETDEQRNDVLSWYNTWLGLPDIVTAENYKDIVYPITPDVIEKYL